MTLALLLAAAVLVGLALRTTRRTSPGRSAAARARRLRTPLVRLVELVGIETIAGRQARRWAAGAEGERRTGRRLLPLRLAGWTVLHDLALPGGRANVDHLTISPSGVAVVVDTKRWSARYQLRLISGRLLHGDRDVTTRLRGIRHEMQAVANVLGVPVDGLVAMDGPPIDGGELVIDGIRIVAADALVPALRGIDHRRRGHGRGLGRAATRRFKPYGRN